MALENTVPWTDNGAVLLLLHWYAKAMFSKPKWNGVALEINCKGGLFYIYIFNIKVYKIEKLNTLPTIYYTTLRGQYTRRSKIT